VGGTVKILTTLMAASLMLGQLALADTSSPNPASRAPSAPGHYGNTRTGGDVLVVRDYLPWGGDVVPGFLAYGVNVTVIPTSQLAATDLSAYCTVFVTGGTSEPFSLTSVRLNNASGVLAAYVLGGGHVLYETGTWGATLQLPGGAYTVYAPEAMNTFTQVHPLAQGVPFPEFFGGSASHDYLMDLPQDANVIITNGGGMATAAEYPLGAGSILVMSQPLECYLPGGACDGEYPHMATLLDNAIAYCLDQADCGGIPVEADSGPQAFTLEGNHPNPFNPVTTITYSLPETAEVSLSVYDLAGVKVASLVDGLQVAGEHQVSFNAMGLGSGLYFYRLSALGEARSGRMLLVK
jgi:hypothetical protein